MYLYLRRDRVIGGKGLGYFAVRFLWYSLFVMPITVCVGLTQVLVLLCTQALPGYGGVAARVAAQQFGQTPFNPAVAAAGISWFLRSGGRHGRNTTVQSGAYSFFFLADCAKHSLPSCFALNADSPYGLTSLPKAPGEKEYRG